MSWLDLVGYSAAFCTTLSFLPQAIKVLKTGDTQALSLIMYSVFTVGVALWLVYGVLIDETVIVLANAITLCLALCILTKKIMNDGVFER